MFPTVILSLFGLTAAISWGTADFFAAKASRRTSPEYTALWVSIIGVLCFVITYLIYPGGFDWKASGIFYALVAGVALELGILMLFRSLDVGPVSIVSPISSGYPLITTLIVVAIFGGKLLPSELIGIIVTVIGICIASGLFDIKASEQKLTKGVAYAISALLLWGVAYAMLGQAVATIGWQKSALIDSSAGLVALILLLKLTSNQKIWKGLASSGYKDKYILSTALIQFFGGIVFTIGLAHANSIATITAISACYPAFTIFLALKKLGEKKRLIPLTGAFITILGVVILSI